MEAIKQEIFNKINNEVYKNQGDIWWDPNTVLYLLKTSVNPARVGYFKRILLDKLKINPSTMNALEVGSGGGILCEEIARMGFATTGIEPAEQSRITSINHAKTEGLIIKYEPGTGENIPFDNGSFDVVFCCDVLEHVRDLPRVIAEINRVLKPGGIFCYDTINRTFISKLVAIKIWQKWERFAFMPPHLHVWEMFIKPSEIIELLKQNKFEPKEQQGTKPNLAIPVMLKYLRKRVKGELTFKELGERFLLKESSDKSILYMGYAIKKK